MRISSGAMSRREGALEEPVERHDPLAALRAQDDRVVERERQGRQVRGRIGVGDRAADRAPVADLDVADARDAVAGEARAARRLERPRRTS